MIKSGRLREALSRSKPCHRFEDAGKVITTIEKCFPRIQVIFNKGIFVHPRYLHTLYTTARGLSLTHTHALSTAWNARTPVRCNPVSSNQVDIWIVTLLCPALDIDRLKKRKIDETEKRKSLVDKHQRYTTVQ